MPAFSGRGEQDEVAHCGVCGKEKPGKDGKACFRCRQLIRRDRRYQTPSGGQWQLLSVDDLPEWEPWWRDAIRLRDGGRGPLSIAVKLSRPAADVLRCLKAVNRLPLEWEAAAAEWEHGETDEDPFFDF